MGVGRYVNKFLNMKIIDLKKQISNYAQYRRTSGYNKMSINEIKIFTKK